MPYVPQEFLDELNALTPDAGTTTALHVSLGSDFDEFFGPEALMRHFDPEYTQAEKDEENKRYIALFREKWPEIREQLITSHLATAEHRRTRIHKWNDSHINRDEPPMSN